MSVFGGVEVNDEAYEKYVSLIECARVEDRKKIKGGTYYESHHIVPRKCGGTDMKENKVLLLGREHFVAHQLLVEMYEEGTREHQKMWCALDYMTGKSKHRDKYEITPEEYENAKIMRSQNMTKISNDPNTKEQNRRANQITHNIPEVKQQNRETQKVAQMRPEVREKKRLAQI